MFQKTQFNKLKQIYFRSVDLLPDEQKYCQEFVIRVRQLLIAVRTIMNKYTEVTGDFPYCKDLQDLLATYVKLEVLMFCKSIFSEESPEEVENLILQTLRYMLYDTTAIYIVDNIKNAEDACILRCLYTLSKVELNIRFTNPSIENMSQKLVSQLEHIKIDFENECEIDNGNSAIPSSPGCAEFFKYCQHIASESIYYFDHDDEAEIEHLQPIYTSVKSFPKIPINPSARPIKVTLGVVTDPETIGLAEYYRQTLFKKASFEYVDSAVEKKPDTGDVILIGEESDDDNDSDNENKSFKRHKRDNQPSPIYIDSDEEDKTSTPQQSNNLLSNEVCSDTNPLYPESGTRHLCSNLKDVAPNTSVNSGNHVKTF